MCGAVFMQKVVLPWPLQPTESGRFLVKKKPAFFGLCTGGQYLQING